MMGYCIGAEINDSFCMYWVQIGTTQTIEVKGAGEKVPEKIEEESKRVGRKRWRGKSQSGESQDEGRREVMREEREVM